VIRRLALFLCLAASLLCGPAAQAQTINAVSCLLADVQSAVNLVVDGGAIAIPNGSCSWTGGITTSKQIEVRALNYTPTPGGTATRSVTLTHNAGGSSLFTFTTGNSHHIGLTGIKFVRGSGTGAYLTVSGSGTKVMLLSDVYFDQPNNFAVLRGIQWAARGGVIWNSMWESLTPGGSSGPGSGSGCFRIESPKTWLDASTWGTQDTNGDQNVYIETSSFRHIYNQALDCDDNCRIVVRHNTILNTQMLHHGTTSLQGGRQSEFYNNAFQYRPATFGDVFTAVNLNRYLWLRAGTTRISDNTIEDITSGTWGSKVEFVFMAESLTRGGAGCPCQSEANYPGCHWSGQGANGSSQVTDPVRIYGNTGTWNWGTSDHTGFGCSGGSTANVFLVNRDIFLSAPTGYTKYPYPHPLTLSGPAPGPPSGLRAP
jgi:hypothetical protein